MSGGLGKLMEAPFSWVMCSQEAVWAESRSLLRGLPADGSVLDGVGLVGADGKVAITAAA
jgi:hypothetical protein